jgi:hypothetical protein
LHWQLLGFQVTMPDTDRSGKDHRVNADTHWVFVRATSAVPTTLSKSISDGVRITPPLIGLILNTEVDSAIASRPNSSVTTNLLCDRARFERSGVLLI